jgi:RHS repeat-associated protein
MRIWGRKAFSYDGDGNLIKQVNQDGSKTIYIDGFYEADRSSGGTLTNTRVYYPAGGAMRINGTLYYALRDNQGSAAAVASATRVAEVGYVRLTLTRPIDSSGNIVGQERYYPFGGTRVTSGSMNTDRLYTGQRSLAALGLMDYHARFYEPTLGVFIQPDTMMPSAANPQSFNRYSYVLNDPINLNDPSGYKPCWATHRYSCDLSKWGRAQADAAVASYSNYSLQDQQAVVNFFNNHNVPVSPISTTGRENFCANNPVACSGSTSGSVTTTGGNSVSSISGLNGDNWWQDPNAVQSSAGWFRSPDYWAGQLSFPIPNQFTGTVVGVNISVTTARGHWYIGVGPSVGKTAILPIAVNVSGGWLLQSSSPSDSQMHNFLTSWTVNVSAGAVVGLGGTWGNPGHFSLNDFAGEGGLYSPQIGGSATYTIVDIGATTTKWLP